MTAVEPAPATVTATGRRRPPFGIGLILLIALAVMHGCHSGGHDLDLEPAFAPPLNDRMP